MNYCVVKRDFNFKCVIPLILIALLTVFVSFLSGMFFSYIPFLIVLIGIIVIVYLSPRFLKTEYEYSIEGGVFSVALIMNKKARRELFSSDIERLVSCQPYADGGSVNGMSKKINAAASVNENYSAVFSSDDGNTIVLFSPSSEFMNELRLSAPSKVRLAQ